MGTVKFARVGDYYKVCVCLEFSLCDGILLSGISGSRWQLGEVLGIQDSGMLPSVMTK